MDLATAQRHLTESLDALSQARKAQSVGLRDRSVSRASVSDLQAQVDYWQRVVNGLQAAAAGISNPTIKVARWS